MALGIANKVIVVVGASSGLGEELARHLVKDGVKLVLGARRIVLIIAIISRRIKS
ncbi:MAG: SDR family NAD(P)-dependent oxidoreductase [Candidatus Arsenophonus phytopathogenicus]